MASLRRRFEGVMVREVDDGVLLLDTESNQIHQLNQTAKFIWNACDEAVSVEQITTLLAEQFNVETNVAANRAHVPKNRRGHGRGGLSQDRIVLAKESGLLDFAKCSQGTDFDAFASTGMNSFELWQTADVNQRLRLEQLLPHGWDQIRTACEHAYCLGLLPKQTNGFLHASRTEQFEFRETQSAPPSATVSRRAGSSGWRSGPLPLNHSEPPCSRN